MATGSPTGEKLPMFVIGKSKKKPSCFKNVKHLPCEYKSQKRSWLNSEILEEWVRKIDRKFVFLPPNMTSILRPRIIEDCCMFAMQSLAPRILKAMKILADSWEVIAKETIINCFRKAGITPSAHQAAIADSDDPFKDLQECLNEMRQLDSTMVPDNVTATLVSLTKK